MISEGSWFKTLRTQNDVLTVVWIQNSHDREADYFCRLAKHPNFVRLSAMKRIFGFLVLYAEGSGRLPSWLILSICLLAWQAPASAQEEVTCVFLSPAKPLMAGTQCSLWLYCMNNSFETAKRTFAPQLKGALIADSGTVDIVLSLITNGGGAEIVMIPPNTFARREYMMEVPGTVSGRVVLTISNYNQITFNVEASGFSPAQVASQHASPPGPDLPVDPTTNAAANQRYFFGAVTNFSKYLTPYEPIYFLLGSYPGAEFQFSLKYQVFDSTNRWLRSLDDLYFGYTQTSFWDLFSSDPSFYDTSYKPSAFFYFRDLLKTKEEKPVQLDLQCGYEHESNGRGGTEERSLNTAYALPTLTIGLPDDLQLSLGPRAWIYVFGVSDNNPDIANYRGYADLTGTVTWKSNYQLTTEFRMGDQGDNPSLQFDFSFALPRSLGFTPRIHAQYFTGYGETLRQYNQISHGFRAGLSLFD
jgi:outer membrane phospholipase A